MISKFRSSSSSLTVVSILLACIAAIPSRATNVGGTLASNTTWTAAESPYFVLANVVVPSGLKLTVSEGVSVHVTNGLSISAQANAAIEVQGTAQNPVQFIPMVGANNWGTISASGNNSSVTIRHAEISHGGVNVGSQATGLVEDTFVHDVASAIVGNSAQGVTIRRVHVKNYSETIFNSGTIVLAEDSLFENMTAANSDALEIQNCRPGSIIRRCTFRHSTGNNSDALDFNGSTNVFVHDCLIYDFSDKGCSVGTATAFNQPAALGIVLSNCLIYSVDSCIAVKDKSTADLFNNTLTGSKYGVRLYEKYASNGVFVANGGGRITNALDNVIWGNATNVDIATNSSMAVTYSDIGGTNFPGTGNISADPIFLNAVLRDYRLATNSPAAGTGSMSGDMGAHFAVGAPMALSHPRIESASVSNGMATVRFWADSEKSYTLQSNPNASDGTWTLVTNVPAPALPELIEVIRPVTTETLFFRLQTP
jgi:hypothetical protein